MNTLGCISHVVTFCDTFSKKKVKYLSLFSKLNTSLVQVYTALSMVHNFHNINNNIMPIHSNSSHTCHCQGGSLLEVCACICKTEPLEIITVDGSNRGCRMASFVHGVGV